MQQTWSQSLTWGNQSWPVPLQQYQAKSHTVEQEEQQWSSGLEAPVLLRLPRQKSKCWSSCSHYMCTRKNCKVTIFLFLFSIQCFERSNVFALCCVAFISAKTQALPESWVVQRPQKDNVRSKSIVHELSVVRGGLFLFEARKDLQKTNS